MSDFERKVRIKIHSDKYDNSEVLLGNFSDGQGDSENQPKHEKTEFVTEGVFKSEDGEVRLLYDDSELFDGSKSIASLIYRKETPNLVTLCREGDVSTAMVFEPGRRHISVYRTPFAPFELCIRTYSVQNRLESSGILKLDYVVEVHGDHTERTRMKITILPKE